MFQGQWAGVVRYGLPGLVAGLALAWWGGGQGPTARAQAMAPNAESGGMIAFTTMAGGSSSQMLYLIDTKSQAFAIYHVEPTSSKGSGNVKLEVARHYKNDLKLEQFNNLAPLPREIEAMARSIAK